MRKLSMLVVLSALTSVIAPDLSAQSEPVAAVLQLLLGGASGDAFGWSVNGAGDIDGDGVTDVVVGAPYSDSPFFGALSGRATVFSGSTGLVIHSWTGSAPQDLFGMAVAAAGDVNGDGAGDVIVGAGGADWNGPESGRAWVFSGSDGSVLYTFDGDQAGDDFGFAVAGVGDVDGDGVSDVCVGAPLADTGFQAAGLARLFSGADGSVIRTHTGTWLTGRLGEAVAAAGDVNADGRGDVLVGSPGADPNWPSAGQAVLYSGLDGSILQIFDGTTMNGQAGKSVAGLGDWNGDSVPDVAVGAPWGQGGWPAVGLVTIHSGLDGSTLFTYAGAPGEAFAFSVCGPGDMTGDGLGDLVCGAPFQGSTLPYSGRVYLFSGGEGDLVIQADGSSQNATFGYSVGTTGDVDGDGLADMVLGAPTETIQNPGWGQAIVASTAHLYAGSGVDFVLGTGTGGLLTGYNVKHARPGQTLDIVIASPAGTFNPHPSFLLYQFFPTGAPTASPVGGFPELHLNLLTVPQPGIIPLGTILPPAGVALTQLPVPAGLTGTSVILQAFSIAGPSARNGIFVSSDAHEIRLVQ